MEDPFIRRMEDLADRCERTSCVASTGFLTPAEQYVLKQWASPRKEVSLLLTGGRDGCERQCAFFLPFYLAPEGFDVSEQICAVKIQSYFGEPGHRDYMGSVLALGIRREWLGDFCIDGDAAWLFCLPSVEPVLRGELTHVGRCGVKVSACALGDVPMPERRVKPLSFTVKSLRLDAVTGEMFSLSRTAAAEQIRLGLVTLNYVPCTQVDAPVKEGDVISLRGKGKGSITALGGVSRKDRLFVSAELLL